MDVILYAAVCPPGQERAAAYQLLEQLLRREFGIGALPEIARRAQGKPWFPARADICFNISHSLGGVVAAVHDRELGVDVEKLRPAPRRLAAGLSDEAFFRRWTAQEATIKRAGADWRSLLCRPTPDENCRCVEDLLPGWIITVCPTGEAAIRAERVVLGA